MSYPFGGLPSIQHNELCDVTAAFCLRFVIVFALNQLYNPVCLDNSSIVARSANVDDGA